MGTKMKKNVCKWWYALCFVFLGIIDQRRGSAVGEIQMLFSNLVGVVMALLLLPSIKLEKEKAKPYLLWTPICVILSVIACIIGVRYWKYAGQWITVVLNVAVWSYLLVYLYLEKPYTESSTRIKQLFFLDGGCAAIIDANVST